MKTKHLSLSFFVALLLGVSGVSYSQNIKVKIQNSKTRKGTVYVALCNDANEFLTEKYKELTSKVSPTGEANVEFTNIPKGNYAIRVYQDTDNSGDLNTSLFGIPEEPFGFSNNPRIRRGPPPFSSASFAVSSNINLTINLIKINQ
jgi:uncharacterized protein (DUF2141 family)